VGSVTDTQLLEPECCDGSDEDPGVCVNICREVGEAHRKKVEAESKLRKTVRHPYLHARDNVYASCIQGSKIRSSYIAFAQKEKTRLEGVITDAKKELSAREKEVKRLQGACLLLKGSCQAYVQTDIVDRTEALSAEALEQKKQSRLSPASHN
jgi:protein kinase C substrate 80K-H